jgi:hypothetical protein
MRTLSEMRPDVDVSKIERPKLQIPDSVANSDLGKAVSNAAVSAGLRRRQATRWPFAVGGLIVAGLAAWAIFTNEAVRSRLAVAANGIRERVASMRSADDRLEIDADEPVAFDVAHTAPIESSPYSESTTVDATGYPEGLGSNNGDGLPAFEESGTLRD